MNYTINTTNLRNKIVEKIETEIKTVGSELAKYNIDKVVVTGEPDSEEVAKYPNGQIKPFICVWFGDISDRGRRTFGSIKLNKYEMSIDLWIVAGTPNIAENIRTLLDDALVGWKPNLQNIANSAGAEQLQKATALANRTMGSNLDGNNKPTRWITASAYKVIPFARKVA